MAKKNKLGFALLLKYFQLEGRYPKHIKDIDPFMLICIANQLNITLSVSDDYDWEGRSTERYRQEVRELLGYRKAKASDVNRLKLWLKDEIFPRVTKPSEFIEYAYHYFREKHIEPFASSKIEEYINSSHSQFEKKLFGSIYKHLSNQTMDLMDKLLTEIDDNDNNDEQDREDINIKFKHLKKRCAWSEAKTCQS